MAQPSSSSAGAGDGALLSLDNLLTQITTANNTAALNHTLKNFASKDVRDTILASTLSSGQDPLGVLDVVGNTLGVLYILSARLHSASSPPPPLSFIESFCANFDPEQARYAPERVTMLAKGIQRLAVESMNNIKYALQPLYDLTTRYPPSLSHLTPLHSLFLTSIVRSRHYTLALPLLRTPITTISTTLSPDLTYNDNLVYHYSGGVVWAVLKKWSEAEEFFESVVCAPGQGGVGSALQLEALKKLVLVQLISKGKTTPPPKYTNALLIRLFKQTPYHNFVNAYPHQPTNLLSIAKKESDLFNDEKNMGLILQAIERAPRWSIKKLTGTYLTLGLAEIGQAVGISGEEEVRRIVLDMIEKGEIEAQLSASGTVTFSDDTNTSIKFTQKDVDKVLKEAEEQGVLLKRLELEMARSREYLSKAVKSKEDAWLGGSMDEELMFGGAGGPGGMGGFAEDVMFTV